MKRSVIGVLLIGCLVLFWGCGARWERTPMVDNADIYVSLERRVEGEDVLSRQYDHPFAADADRLARFLSELRYKEPPRLYGEAKKLPVFQPMEIRRLTPALAGALAEAGPEQRVRFVSYNRGGGLIFKKMRRTGGVFFIDAESRLNLAFGYINHEIDEEFRGVRKDKRFTDPLIIDAAKQNLKVSSDAVGHRTKNGGKMPLWLVADADLLSAGGRPALSSGPDEAEKSADRRPEEPPAESEDNARGQSRSPAGEQTAEPGTPVADEPVDEGWQRQKDAVKKKLEYFKELHDAELITTEEYNARKRELLDRIQ